MSHSRIRRYRARLTRGLAAVVLALAVVLGSASCAGGGDRVGPTPSPSSTGAAGRTDPAAALVEFHACLRANGVAVSDSGPGVARGESEDPDFAAAAAKCKHHLEGTSIEVATGGDGGHVSAEQLEALLGYARCMRGRGIEMPDPDPDSGAVAPKGSTDFDEESDEFRTAHAACRSHLSGAEVEEGGAS